MLGSLCVWLLVLLPLQGHAQVYYTLSDGAPTSTTDQLRSVAASGTGDVLIKDNFVQAAGSLVLDAANNRLLVADTRLSQSTTSLTNTKIVAVSLAPGNAVSTLITPTYIAGSASTGIAGIEIDRVNNYLYYTLNDGAAATATDQLRRVNLDGTGDVLIKDNFVQVAGSLVLDAANNRLLVADTRPSQSTTSLTNTKIVAVSLAPGNAVSTLITPTYIAGSASTGIAGIEIDRVNNYLYYTLNDGAAATATDQLRRVNLDGTGDVLIKDNFVQAAGSLVLDAANNRLLVADTRPSQSTTSLTNTKIVAVSLAPGNAVSTLITPTYIAGSTSTVVSGLALLEAVPPTVTTATPGTLTNTSAALGGNVTADGGASVSGRGVVYSSTNTTPTIGGSGVTQAANGTGTGTFSATTSGLAPATTYYVRAYASNSAGTSYGSVVSFGTLPNAPVITSPTNGQAFASSTPLYTGTAQAGSTVTVFVDLTAIGTTTATGGNFSLAQPTALAEGSHTVYARATLNGATSANSTTFNFTVDTNAPNTTLTATPPALSNSASATFTFTGTDTGSGVASFQAGLDGGAFATATSPRTYTGLSDGSHTFQVRAIDNAGNVDPTPAAYSWTVDTTPPAAPVVLTPANGSQLSTTTPTYSGTAEPGTTVAVLVDGSSVGTTTASGAGTWTFTQPTALAQGSHTVKARASDAVGNSSVDSNTNTFTVDTARPAVVISSTSGANGGTTATSPLQFAVTFSESVTGFAAGGVSVGNGTLTGFAGSGSTYTFSVTPTTAGTPTTVNVPANVAQDGAGNGNTAAAQYSLTYTPPTATVVSVTRLTLSPTATAQVRYRVVFSGPVTGLTTANFNLTTSVLSGAAVASVSGSGTTYTVVVNTGTGDGALTLNVANSTGVSPTLSNVPYTAGETYSITKSFAAAPTLRIQAAGSASGNGDVTAFVDVVQVLQSGTSTVVPNGLQNGSFETNNVPAAGFKKTADGVVAAPWSFTGTAGVARYGSGFDSQIPGQPQPLPPNGDAVALIQSAGDNNASLSQNLAVPTGSYQVNFQTAQRYYTAVDQRLNVFVNDVFVGNIQSGQTPAYGPFTSASFNVFAPGLTATVSTTSASPTSTAPIPFAVSFSQSVGTSFTAADVTVTGGTLTSGSFSGSGAGPYTFTVTPAGSGTVSVSLASGVALDANNTSNSTSNTVSVQYAQLVTAAPVVLAPANGSLLSTSTPAYSGTAPANSTVTVYVDLTSIGTTPADATGNWVITQPTALAQGSHTVYATAQTNGSTASANSNTNNFVIDTVRPTVAITSSAGASGGTTGTSPIPFTVTFSENVSGFVTGDITVTNGTISSFSGGSGISTYTFSVTPTTPGTATTVNVPANVAQDQAGNGNTAAASTYSLTFVAPTIAVAPATLPNGTVAVAYSQTLTASGGTGSYTYTVSAGALPAGLALASGGTLAGTPTASGTFTFTVTATDASAAPGPYSGTRVYTLTIAAPTITVAPATLPNATAGSPYSQVITASGGTAPYTFAVSAGALPAGLALAAGGTLAGTPTASGTFNFTVRATDATTGAGPYNSSRAYTLAVAAQPGTAAPTVLAPANGALTNNPTPTYSGTAPAGSTVTVYVDLTAIGTTTASGAGSFSLPQPTSLSDGSHTVYATAQAAGATVSGNSNTNTFTVDTARPAVAISSTSGANGGTTATSPLQFAVTFSESVTGFAAGGVSVGNGTLTGFAGSGSTYTFSVTPTTAGTATTVNVGANVAQDGAGNGNTAAAQYSLTYLAPITATIWTGNLSTDWFTAGNWTAGVPTPTVDATIPTVSTRSPILTAGTATAKNLTIGASAGVLHTGGTLSLTGNFINNGTYTGFNTTTGGTVALTGPSAQTMGGSSPLRFWNLSVGASGATQAVAVDIARVLTLTGNLSTGGQPLTLLSSAQGDALVNNAGGVVNGTATVQRYIDPSLNPGLGYRHYSAPVSNTTVNDLATAGFAPVVNSAYNTSPTPGLVTGFPTVFGYDQSRLTLSNNLSAFDKGFFSPATLSDPLAVGRGYTVNIGASQLVDFVGTLNNGDVNVPLASNRASFPDGGWQLLGNPYPAPIDYSTVPAGDRVNLEGAIYVYSSTAQYAGQYRSYVNGVGGNPVIPAGQGFFARVAAGQSAGSITFRNANRLTAPSGTTFQRGTSETRPLVQLTLRGATGVASDEAYVYFEAGATAGIDPQYDAVKLPNTTGLNLASVAAGTQLAINGLPTGSTTTVTVPLAVAVPAPGTYTLRAAQVLNFPAGAQPFLRDLQLGTLTDLSLTPAYTFTQNAATTTPRFELVFGAQPVLGTAPGALAAQVALFPNPATQRVYIELPSSLSRTAVTAGLVDALGRTVLTQALPAGLARHTLPLTNLATGVYSLRLLTEAGVVVKRLVVE
ncbi:T9SS type A sorting domain-containing protein [Hymenobacter sp. BT189]|uniref:T9SS type A sorting domain-containing protein n=1 Tax=Hymenobacter armeniacus TaxID=2771358 RepID=A0ABR8JVV1_9BACT|nr:T9SS type A sorting domain-containing protein [Hymenobacter armeniacus]